MKKKEQKKYTDDFKKEAVRLALESGKPKSTIAKELNISTSHLYAWINKYDQAKSRGLTVEQYNDEQEQMKQLKAQLKRLQQENAILKKAAAYFAKEQL